MERGERERDFPRRAIAVILIAGIALPFAGALMARALFAHQTWQAGHLHAIAEAVGGCIAAALAALILELRRHYSQRGYHVWVAAAFTAIAVVDITHAIAPGDELWFEGVATLLSGVLFAMVWCPSRWAPRASIVVPAAAVVALALSLVSITGQVPVAAMTADSGFSGLSHLLNGLGAIAFLAAAGRFLVSYRDSESWDDYLFAVLCALFGASAFAFDDALPWTGGWWWRHLLRVSAFGVLLGAAIRNYVDMHERLRLEISERGGVEAALRESENQLTKLIFGAADGILTADEAGSIVSANPAAVSIFGYPQDELVGMNLRELLAEAHRDRDDDWLEQGSAIHPRGTDRSLEGQRRDGRTFPLELSINELRSHGRRMYSVFVRDLTERVELEEQLRHSQKMEAVGTLASGIAHDFNNLLMGITGCADVARSTSNASVVREQLAVIKQEAEKGAALTRQLLAFGRKRTPVQTTLHVDSVVAETESMLRNILGEDITLGVELSGSDAHVLGERGQLQQVLLNLCINGRDAMQNGGLLALRVGQIELSSGPVSVGDAEGGMYVTITVRDTGSGIPPDVMSRMFDPFYTTKAVGDGTGLGLAMVYGIVKRSGGWVDVESEVGRGTVFTIYLPCVEPRVEERPRELSAVDLRGKETVLVVEDVPAVRRSIEHYLSRWGYTTLSARDGREALDLCRDPSQPLDLLLTDVVLPGMSGPEIARVLQVRRPGLSVVFMSAYPEDKLVEDGRIPAGVATIHKPFTEGQLIARVRSTLDARHEDDDYVPKPALETGDIEPTVLLVEDHVAARQAVAELLRDQGYRVVEADCGKQALELCGKALRAVDVVLTDIRLPDMLGPDLVSQVCTNGGIGVVYMSGLSPDDPLVRKGVEAGAGFVQKPADFDDISRQVASALRSVAAVARAGSGAHASV